MQKSSFHPTVFLSSTFIRMYFCRKSHLLVVLNTFPDKRVKNKRSAKEKLSNNFLYISYTYIQGTKSYCLPSIYYQGKQTLHIIFLTFRFLIYTVVSFSHKYDQIDHVKLMSAHDFLLIHTRKGKTTENNLLQEEITRA